MSSNKYSIRHKKNELYQIGPGFWNVRGHFRVFAKMVDIGTQMSIAQMSNGNFVVFDTVELNNHLRSHCTVETTQMRIMRSIDISDFTEILPVCSPK
jgi:hypothetical protein